MNTKPQATTQFFRIALPTVEIATALRRLENKPRLNRRLWLAADVLRAELKARAGAALCAVSVS